MSDTPIQKATGEIVDDAAEALRSAGARAADRAKAGVDKARASVSTAVDDAADTASDALRAAGTSVSDRVQQVSRTAQRLAEGATETVRSYPIPTVLIVAGAGAIAGFLVGLLVARRD